MDARAAPGADPRLATSGFPRLGRLRQLLPFFSLYVSFGMTLGFLTGGAPLILRVRGVELAQIGLLQVINLPLGLTFLWAVVIDRVRLPGLPHRIGWIALMQGGTLALLIVLAACESAPLIVLFAIGVATCVCVATMDIALEALVVETVPREDRFLVSSAKFCGASFGGILGAGILVGSYSQLGWPALIGVVALLDAICLIPILAYPETRLHRPGTRVERHGGHVGRMRFLARHILVLGFYFAALYAISGSNSLALVDLGLSLAQVSMVSGTLASLINLIMALVSGLLVRRLGTVRLISGFATGMVLASGLMVFAMANGSGVLGVVATIGCYVCSSGLGVPVFNMLYRWSEGPRPATDYALLFGAAFFASMPVRLGGPAVASNIGWTAYFAFAILLYVAAFMVLRHTIKRTLASGRPTGAGTKTVVLPG